MKALPVKGYKAKKCVDKIKFLKFELQVGKSVILC